MFVWSKAISSHVEIIWRTKCCSCKSQIIFYWRPNPERGDETEGRRLGNVVRCTETVLRVILHIRRLYRSFRGAYGGPGSPPSLYLFHFSRTLPSTQQVGNFLRSPFTKGCLFTLYQFLTNSCTSNQYKKISLIWGKLVEWSQIYDRPDRHTDKPRLLQYNIQFKV